MISRRGWSERERDIILFRLKTFKKQTNKGGRKRRREGERGGMNARAHISLPEIPTY